MLKNQDLHTQSTTMDNSKTIEILYERLRQLETHLSMVNFNPSVHEQSSSLVFDSSGPTSISFRNELTQIIKRFLELRELSDEDEFDAGTFLSPHPEGIFQNNFSVQFANQPQIRVNVLDEGTTMSFFIRRQGIIYHFQVDMLHKTIKCRWLNPQNREEVRRIRGIFEGIEFN